MLHHKKAISQCKYGFMPGRGIAMYWQTGLRRIEHFASYPSTNKWMVLKLIEYWRSKKYDLF